VIVPLTRGRRSRSRLIGLWPWRRYRGFCTRPLVLLRSGSCGSRSRAVGLWPWRPRWVTTHEKRGASQDADIFFRNHRVILSSWVNVSKTFVRHSGFASFVREVRDDRGVSVGSFWNHALRLWSVVRPFGPARRLYLAVPSFLTRVSGRLNFGPHSSPWFFGEGFPAWSRPRVS